MKPHCPSLWPRMAFPGPPVTSPSAEWRASMGCNDLSQRQLWLLRDMLNKSDLSLVVLCMIRSTGARSLGKGKGFCTNTNCSGVVDDRVIPLLLLLWHYCTHEPQYLYTQV